MKQHDRVHYARGDGTVLETRKGDARVKWDDGGVSWVRQEAGEVIE